LGGQHFVKALQLLRHRKLGEMIDKDERLLPPSLQWIEAEVMTQGAPLGLRASMAGQHQKKQSLTEACTLSDFFKLVCDSAMAKKQIALSQKSTNPDRCVFNDDQIGVLLERSGMKTDEANEGDPTPGLKKDDVLKAAKAKVCRLISQFFYRCR
jgi:hypothetical protein